MPFSWSGLSLDLPAKWRPVKIGGDDDKGEVLFADVDRPLMGLRWEVVSRRVVEQPARGRAFVERRMRDEVGKLSAEGAVDATPAGGGGGDWAAGLLFVEPEPPGRDVWVGLSATTRRAVQLVVHRRGGGSHGRLLADRLLPSLVDVPNDEPRRWAVFDLDVTVPAGHALRSHKLAAGDMRLSWTRREGRRRLPLTVRQVRPASLALSRRPMAEWLSTFAWEAGRFHKPRGAPVEIEDGLRQMLPRRRRYGWLGSVPRSMVAEVRHDREADRLLLARGVEADVAAALGGA